MTIDDAALARLDELLRDFVSSNRASQLDRPCLLSEDEIVRIALH